MDLQKNSLRTAALIVAAGRGVRAGGGLPKQYRSIGNQPILRRTIQALLAMPFIDAIQCVIHDDDANLYAMAIDGLTPLKRLRDPICGGASRQASVKNGLEGLRGQGFTHVLVHDAVRPFASVDLYQRVMMALNEAPGAIAALAVTDTLRRSDSNQHAAGTVERAGLWAAQTPQGFHFDVLMSAHNAAHEALRDGFTDDAALLEWRGHAVALVEGEVENFKITGPADFVRAECVLKNAGPMSVRTGLGYDVHAFTDGDHVTIGGVKIPHHRGVLAHSDGDVVLHALTDAVLGALCDGDIGRHFPPSDEKWRNASSDQFLKYAVDRVRQTGGEIINLDATLIAEAPRIGPHRERIREAIAAAAGVARNAVSIKATTSEQLGFTGRGEGLAAMAIATITLPSASL